MTTSWYGNAPPRWEVWFTAFSRTFERKLVHEMGFDGIIRLFEIHTDDVPLNDLLIGRLFLDFHHAIKNGVFLRHIRSPEDWPNTTLVFLNPAKRELREILRSSSSFLVWPVHSVTDSEFTLVTEHNQTRSKGYKIHHNGESTCQPFISHPSEEGGTKDKS